MDINRTSLIKIAMSQYLRHNRMLFKLENKKIPIKEFENDLKKLKEFDANEIKLIKIPKKENLK